ncbi:hypothetical protein PX699_00610 [Sphingobium sp. H39-3-25]|uniref:hypothetical protein n=1 Tax=Sphingobium arseniciresistens TaxID=3030834 RepID=UPI0023B99962|nr:hypothetical protein [Sphingobium arseniciresistens]
MTLDKAGTSRTGKEMKNRNYGSFENRSRRRINLPIIPIVLAVLVIGVLWLLWSRGGEQPQKPVEVTIPAEKLGQ